MMGEEEKLLEWELYSNKGVCLRSRVLGEADMVDSINNVALA